MKIVSIGNNSLGYRIFVIIVGLSFIFGLNYFLFAYFIGNGYSIYFVVFWLFLGVFLWYLIKYSKYKYILDDKQLYIKTPTREYKIPLSDIKKVGFMEKIPFVYRLGMKFDAINKILYLCPFSNSGIVLKLETHDIVISPRKMEEFRKQLGV